LYDQQLVSDSDFDAAQAQKMTAISQVELAKAQIAQAEANLRGALLQLGQTRIVAPFDGFIGKRHLDLGAYATTNRPIFSIVDLSRIRTTIAIPAVAATHIEQGQTARVEVDALPGEVFNGEVSRISSVFDPQTNTVEAEVEIANENGVLKPGMFANVAVAYRTEPTALLVPAAAVVRNDREEWIFVAEPSGDDDVLTARRVPVSATQPGFGTDERVAVESLEGELRPGMKIVVLGQESLREGAPVIPSDGVSNQTEHSR
ncbi:MAG: efflux RND transporter periplasmic adaptor subunit, partial [Acidobacteria bacterium]|nr:efflux RND transporter periplasmic adaptor subunit [Acidobacteriota bacterium]